MLCENPSCGKPMRPAGVPREARPGTVLHGGYGYCARCRNKELEHGAPVEELTVKKKDRVKAHRENRAPACITDEQLALADPWTRDYIADRRRRGIPAEGKRGALA